MRKVILPVAMLVVGVFLFRGAWAKNSEAGIKEFPGRIAKTSAVAAVPSGQVVATAENDLSARLERLRAWTDGRDRSLGRGDAFKILEEWSVKDAPAALEFVKTAPYFAGRNAAYAVPLARIAVTNPREAANWILREVGKNSEKSEIVEALAWRCLREAPAAALDVLTMSGADIGNEVHGHLLGEVAKTNPGLALRGFVQMDADLKHRLLEPMMETWGRANPGEALTWYLGCGMISPDVSAALAASCVKSGKFNLPDLVTRLKLNTDQADEILYQLTWNGEVLDTKSLGLFSERARLRAAQNAGRNLEESPDRVLAFVQATVSADRQAEALLWGWRSWLESDRQGATTWLQQMPDRRLASELTARLERSEQMRDPAKALALAKTIINQQEKKTLVDSAVNRLAWREPAQAANWLMQNPAEEIGAGTVGVLASRYLESDDAGAMAWIARLNAGAGRDEALRRAAMYWAGKEVDFATVAMSTIGDTQKRQQCMFGIFRRLSRENANKADQWLESQGLSADVRQSWKALGQSTGDYSE